MPREQFRAGDFVMKGAERGQVVERISNRTQRPYLTVKITNGPRLNQYEFPERGWQVDDGSYGGNERPTSDHTVATEDAFYRPFRQRAVNRACMKALEEESR